jgi:hypothetical protein
LPRSPAFEVAVISMEPFEGWQSILDVAWFCFVSFSRARARRSRARAGWVVVDGDVGRAAAPSYGVIMVGGAVFDPPRGHRVNLIVRESRARATPPSCGFVWPRATGTLWRRPGETAAGGMIQRTCRLSIFQLEFWSEVLVWRRCSLNPSVGAAAIGLWGYSS